MPKEKKKVKSKKYSLKYSLFICFPICAVFSLAGAFLIGIATNEAQDLYNENYVYIQDRGETTVHAGDREALVQWTEKPKRGIWYEVISGGQYILVPLWVLFCVAVIGHIFYKRELEEPIDTLLQASEKIAENDLEFSIETRKQNELGELCHSFEQMRGALYQNNQKMWRMLEERKRLNAAFSHDMRTPVTVLKGYTEFLSKYVPDGRVSREKLTEILGLMEGQISRLESYTVKMGSLQKLEDLTPELRQVVWEDFVRKCRFHGRVMAEQVEIIQKESSDAERVCMDENLVLEVYENLVANALRYASRRVSIDICVRGERLFLSVSDDGAGFGQEALRRAAEPFYRGEKAEEKQREHFGLGLYICRIICEKCGGGLTIENMDRGAKVKAEFSAPIDLT